MFQLPGSDDPPLDADIAVGTFADRFASHGWYYNAISFCNILPTNLHFVFNVDNSDFREEVEAIEKRIATINSRLYDGSAKIAADDALAMSQEVTHLNDRRRVLDA